MQKLRRNFSPTAAPINNEDCNCGSYALNLLDWFTPFERNEADEEGDWDERFQHIIDVHLVTKSKEDTIKLVLEEDVEFMLRSLPELRRIQSPEEGETNERVIAYRLMVILNEYGEVTDTDFHFRVRINDKWSEKCGSCPIQDCCFDEDITSPWIDGSLKYEGEIAYFAMPEPLEI